MAMIIFSGLIYGYSIGAISGATTGLRAAFATTPLMEGLLSGFFLLGAMIGAITGVAISDSIGRKKVCVGVSEARTAAHSIASVLHALLLCVFEIDSPSKATIAHGDDCSGDDVDVIDRWRSDSSERAYSQVRASFVVRRSSSFDPFAANARSSSSSSAMFWVVVFFRSLVGLGVGLASSICPLYVTESLASSKKGSCACGKLVMTHTWARK